MEFIDTPIKGRFKLSNKNRDKSSDSYPCFVKDENGQIADLYMKDKNKSHFRLKVTTIPNQIVNVELHGGFNGNIYGPDVRIFSMQSNDPSFVMDVPIEYKECAIKVRLQLPQPEDVDENGFVDFTLKGDEITADVEYEFLDK